MKAAINIIFALTMSLFLGATVEAATVGVVGMEFVSPILFAGSFVKVSGNVLAMKVGNLAASTSGQILNPNTPEFIQVGTIDTDIPLSALNVSISGRQTIRLTAQARIQAFAKLVMRALLGADVKVPMLLPVARAAINGQQVDFSYTNAGATTPNVYFWSTLNGNGENTVPARATETVILAESSQNYSGFFALIFSATNFDYAQVTFVGGRVETMSADELAAMFAATKVADADGKLAGLLVVDNSPGQIDNITLFTTSGGSLVVAMVNL